MAITFNEIAELVARFGNSVVTEQANMASPFVGKGIIKKESHSGTVGIVNVKSGGIQSTGFIADGGALPDGQNKHISWLIIQRLCLVAYPFLVLLPLLP